MGQYAIAIDGGGTRCRAVLVDRRGRRLGAAAGGAANIFSRADDAVDSIVAAARAAVEDAGLAVELSAIPALLGLAGLNVGARQQALAGALPFADTRFVHDGIIALEGALGDADGVIAIFGTGSVYVARAAGESRIVGGWGFMIGDQASGAELGRTLMQEALLAHDGICEMTPLAGAVLDRFGGDPQALVEFTLTARPADYGACAPMLFAFEADGDPLAARILAAAVRDITAALDAVVFAGCRRLCLLGGLGERYGARLEARHRTLLQAPRGDALDGAVELARRAFLLPAGGAATP